MKHIGMRGIGLLLALVLTLSLSVSAFAAPQEEPLEAALRETAEYVHHQTSGKLTVSSIGGEWAVFGLARSGQEVPDGFCGFTQAWLPALIRLPALGRVPYVKHRLSP